MWREQLAGVPFERRLLLLPKCLRVESKCPAPFDEFGLLCKQCGLCSIQDLQAEAERLGYAVLVAEGTAIVMSLIQTGKIEAIVGVSCLSVLERAFPYMEAAAIPGVAMPLLQDDCIDTTVDLDWVWDYIHLTSDDQTRRLDLGRSARRSISGSRRESRRDHGTGGRRDREHRARLADRAGKRWRPFLTVSRVSGPALDARRGAAGGSPQCRGGRGMLPQGLADPRRHRGRRRASLRRNDAARRARRGRRAECGRPAHRRRLPAARRLPRRRGEGGDDPRRRRRPARTLPRPGRGTRLGAAAGAAQLAGGARYFPPQNRARLQVALNSARSSPASSTTWTKCSANTARRSASPTRSATISTTSARAARRTTSPACAQPAPRDGLRACRAGQRGADTALAATRDPQRLALEAHWRRLSTNSPAEIEALFLELGADTRCRDLLERYKEEAIRTLARRRERHLKGLLRRVIGKIFNDTEIKGWCKEFEEKNLGPSSALNLSTTSSP